MRLLACLLLATPLSFVRAQAQSLEPGHWFSMVYHNALRRVVLVNGGPERGGKSPNAPVEIWSWDGTRWNLVAADTSGPRWRNFAVATYDARRDRIVLYGGRQYGTDFDDTWEWDGRAWTRFAVSGPGPRYSAESVYDKARGVSILVGGAAGERVFGDAWTWDGKAWAPLVAQSGPSPSPRGSIALAYDDAHRTVVMYGGHFPSFTEGRNFDELWEWNGAQWRLIDAPAPKPGIRVNARAVFDTARKSIVLIGGGEDAATLGDDWRWDGSRWSSLGNSGFGPRNAHGLAYDAARGRLVLFGGITVPGGNQRRDTWEYVDARWSCVAGC